MFDCERSDDVTRVFEALGSPVNKSLDFMNGVFNRAKQSKLAALGGAIVENAFYTNDSHRQTRIQSITSFFNK